MVGLCQEGERAAVVLGAARVELALEDAIKIVLRPNPGGSDDLFEGDRPLSTFSAKICFAYRLSLIENNLERALQLLRKIRNEFAHSHEKLTLSSGAAASRLRELQRLCEVNPTYKIFGEQFGSAAFPPELKLFAQCIASILTSLEAAKFFIVPYVLRQKTDLGKTT